MRTQRCGSNRANFDVTSSHPDGVDGGNPKISPHQPRTTRVPRKMVESARLFSHTLFTRYLILRWIFRQMENFQTCHTMTISSENTLQTFAWKNSSRNEQNSREFAYAKWLSLLSSMKTTQRLPENLIDDDKPRPWPCANN